MKTIKTIMDVPKDLYAMWMARGLNLGTPLNEVLEDIKAEIESYVSEEPHQLMSKTTVLEIIDKYREEQE